MCRVNSQMANYRNSSTQITADNVQDTNETDTTKQADKQINQQKSDKRTHS
jgi:hypothetical protein